MKNIAPKPLHQWIERKAPLPPRFYIPQQKDVPSEDWPTWLALEECHPLHQAETLTWQSFEDSRQDNLSYLSAASDTIDGLQGGWLDSEERLMILENIGPPPAGCLPIYIVSCSKGESEELMYIGKTKSSKRFSGGHSIALKLHAPQYRKFKKRIYRCSIWFHIDNDYIPLEWINDDKLALQILDDIESLLIYHLRPALNVHKKKSLKAKHRFHIHIQNFTTLFLNDEIIYLD